ncbi:MAG: prenyltransferase, partial [Oscillospiraceae bacterium]|nr:prenyltransferase [Oscillospiraceae bacterium]
RHTDGGWRCKKFSFGHGPETESSNPLPTLSALDSFRYSDEFRNEPSLDRAVEFLLEHWTIRTPIGPCHYGMGTLFMQVEYPFRNYNLFVYVYVLSFFEKARTDKRFLEALQALESKTIDGQIVVERVVPKLAALSFCKKGQPSELATRRYREILLNMG